jgi:hypothetical protein
MAAISEADVSAISLSANDMELLFPPGGAPAAHLGRTAHIRSVGVINALDAIVGRSAADDKVASNARTSRTAALGNTLAGNFLTAAIAGPLITAITKSSSAADLYPLWKPFAICAVLALLIHALGRWSLVCARVGGSRAQKARLTPGVVLVEPWCQGLMDQLADQLANLLLGAGVLAVIIGLLIGLANGGAREKAIKTAHNNRMAVVRLRREHGVPKQGRRPGSPVSAGSGASR